MKVDGMNKYDYLARLKEPSTYAGLAGFLGIFGVTFAPVEVQTYAMLGGMLAGVLGMVIPEQGAKK